MLSEKFVAISGVLLIIGGCSENRQHPSACDYATIAKKNIHEIYPDYDVNRPVNFEDHGKFVEVFFPLKPGWIGGSPRSYIDKGTCRVLKTFRTQ